VDKELGGSTKDKVGHKQQRKTDQPNPLVVKQQVKHQDRQTGVDAHQNRDEPMLAKKM
jgi:hypothetical protein